MVTLMSISLLVGGAVAVLGWGLEQGVELVEGLTPADGGHRAHLLGQRTLTQLEAGARTFGHELDREAHPGAVLEAGKSLGDLVADDQPVLDHLGEARLDRSPPVRVVLADHRHPPVPTRAYIDID